MSLQKKILNFVLMMVDVATFWLRPKKNRIQFISLTQDHLDSDFKCIYEGLEQTKKYEIHTNLIVFEKNLKGSFLYFLNCIKQLVELKRSALVIINDNNYVISTRKPKTCKVLQVWHACGAIKKFGNQIKREYPIKNYDAILCNGSYWKDVYASAFGVDRARVYVTGMPRTDDLLAKKSNFLDRHPELRNKKLILYAPTFRGNIIKGFQIPDLDMDWITKNLSEDYVFLYKFHPLLGDVKCKGDRMINCNHEDLYDLLQVAHCLISDYSSVVFDYSLLHKPMFLYVPDLDEYDASIGLNVDITKEFVITKTKEDVLNRLKESSTLPSSQAFQEKYMEFMDGKNTERVIECIEKLMMR